ncbi:MAG: glycosyltransferase family 2 protein [Parasporobacterium sp.]|nr:glycosyltransferase family 2 protein [Parasporobacterium sp.]
MRRDTLLVIPAYNEEESITGILNGLVGAGAQEYLDILVINDGSSDRTSETARDFGKGVRVLDLLHNMGYGAALQTGYKYAVMHNYSWVLQMDADGQHDPVNLPLILEKLKETENPPDIVIGSRFLDGGQSFKISGIKKIAISFFRGVIRIFTGCRLTDPTSGLQGLNRSVVEYYSGYNNFDIRYPDLNMIVQMLFLGFRVEEVPAVMHPRTAGKSMHSGPFHGVRYMAVMLVSTFNAYTRYHGKKEKIQKQEKSHNRKGRKEN